jgi:hypothetical protein
MVKSTTEKATYNLIHDILKALNNKLIVEGIFCDLEKYILLAVTPFCLN